MSMFITMPFLKKNTRCFAIRLVKQVTNIPFVLMVGTEEFHLPSASRLHTLKEP